MKKLLGITALAATSTLSLSAHSMAHPISYSNDDPVDSFREAPEGETQYDFFRERASSRHLSYGLNQLGDFNFQDREFDFDTPIVINTSLADLFEIFLKLIDKKGDFFPPHHGHYPHHRWKHCNDPVNPVPVPAAAWLFGSALLSAAGLRRHSRSH